ncbi:MAG: hypothetical protein H6814_04200 [Phycisphaeraceae bacterium]|nr:hypothetical protein [Phycisphaeraceae bacterium]
MRTAYSTGRVITGFILVGLAVVAFSGCASNKPRQPRQVAQHDEVIRAFSPEWYGTTLRDAEGRILKTAQAVGANPTISESLAINIARQAMAMAVDARVDSLQRNFQEQLEAGDELDLIQRFQDANNIVTSTALRGSHVVRKETYVEDGGRFRTFVMMQLDPREIDASVLDAAKAVEALETRLRSSETWEELERRARELREERLRGGAVGPMTDREIRGKG